MGIFKMSVSSFTEDKLAIVSQDQKVFEEKFNPDPYNYKIKSYTQLYNYLILEINYPNCLNYEGNKILVFKGVTLKDIKKQKCIDPHFSDNKNYISPIARFEPTKEGLSNAITFVIAMNK